MRRLGGLKRRKDSYYRPNNKEPVELIFNSKDEKTKYFQNTFFSWKQDQMRSDWTSVKRFVDLFTKMDHLLLSDFREMRLKSKEDFDIAFSTVINTGLDAYSRIFMVF